MATGIIPHVVLPLPEVPAITFFNETQWKVYFALMDTVIPSIISETQGGDDKENTTIKQKTYDDYYTKVKNTVANPPSREAFEAYLSEKPSAIPAFRDHTVRTLGGLPDDMRQQLASILYLLGSVYT